MYIGARHLLFMVLGLSFFTTAWAQKRMIPHVSDPQGGFSSQLFIANNSGEAQAYQLLGFDKSGQQIGQAVGTIAPFETGVTDVAALFQGTPSHVEIAQAEALTISIAYQRTQPGTGPAQVLESAIQSDRWRIYLGNTQVTWDGLAAVNTSAEAINISAQYFGPEGQSLTEPQMIAENAAAMSKTLFLFNDPQTAIAPAFVDIQATGTLALLALRGNLASEYLWENQAIALEGQSAPETRFLVHVTAADGGFTSSLILNNTSENDASLQIQAFNSDGAMVNTLQQELQSEQMVVLNALATFGTETSHLTISGAPEVLATMSYQREEEGSGSAQVHQTALESKYWRMYPGNTEVTWDGIAIINQGENPADVTVSQIDAQGRLIRGPITLVQQLAPRAKSLHVLSSDFQNMPQTHFEINATEKLAIMAIRGNLASEFLWENAAAVLPAPPPQVNPPARIDYAFAYHPQDQTAIMVGGFDENFALLEDTWQWNGRRWHRLDTPNSPLPRSHHGGTFYPPTEQMVIFGGFRGRTQKDNDFMAFDGNDWQPFPGNASIPADDGELVYDATRNTLILTVSSGNQLQTWEYQNNQWQQRNTAANPGKRLDQAFVYEAHTGRTILFGGLTVGNAFSDETWSFDGQTWEKLTPSQSPPALIGAAAYYDSKRQRIVLFGGMNAARQIVDDLWVFQNNTWEKLEITPGPEARWVAYAIYNPVRDVATLFGGEGQNAQGLTMFRDTWEFDGMTWQKR